MDHPYARDPPSFSFCRGSYAHQARSCRRGEIGNSMPAKHLRNLRNLKPMPAPHWRLCQTQARVGVQQQPSPPHSAGGTAPAMRIGISPFLPSLVHGPVCQFSISCPVPTPPLKERTGGETRWLAGTGYVETRWHRKLNSCAPLTAGRHSGYRQPAQDIERTGSTGSGYGI
jgi:hypothetical protein